MNPCVNSNVLITQNALKNRGLSNPHTKKSGAEVGVGVDNLAAQRCV